MSAAIPARVALVAAALVVAAWLALSLHASNLEGAGRAPIDRLSSRVPTRAEADAAIRQLRRSRHFSADRTPLVEQAMLLYATGRPGQAAAVARRVARDEPDDLSAWQLLLATSRSDPAERRLARTRIAALDPYAPTAPPSQGITTAGLVPGGGNELLVRPSGARRSPVQVGVAEGRLERVTRSGQTLMPYSAGRAASPVRRSASCSCSEAAGCWPPVAPRSSGGTSSTVPVRGRDSSCGS